ncbi:cell wall-active antibiotics response protein LiaF [Cohnella algarum]|uniref:cell wall-active antibiotics response protein LiaF n=1 Tax=Cohnella algarum TaxID=2044859 RepID=UPI001967E424|nr:cell wall-active antibiotics response protein LiaF [Cohnella algarum]MBN2979868.1 cell wall-active antibiotics response protein [Cohnella algarum]
MKQSVIQRLFWGIILVGIGFVFLLDQTGVVDADIGELFGVFWPVLLVLVGVYGLLMQAKGGGYWWNFIIIFFGIFFLGKNLDWFDWDFGDMVRIVGPVALILFGISVIFNGNKSESKKRHRHGDDPGSWNPVTPPAPGPMTPPPAPPGPMMGPPPAPPEYDRFDDKELGGRDNPEAREERRNPGEFGTSQPWGSDPKWKGHAYQGHRHHGNQGPFGQNHSRFIGDFHIGKDYFELKPMNISMFIGDTKIDLTRAHIPFGETRINVSTFIGDVKIFVPNDLSVAVRVESNCLIGDVKLLDQKREGFFNHMSVETPGFGDYDKQIVLVVSTFIGDVRVSKVG